MTMDSDKQPVKLLTVLAACSSNNRRTARMWLYYTLFYWMFPTLAVIFTYILANQRVKLLDLIIHGELLIYAITIVAGSTRLIAKDLPNRGPFVNRQAFNLTSHIMIFPAIVAYAIVRYLTATANPTGVNAKVVVVYSIALLIAAFIFSYVVFLIDAQRSTPDELPRRIASEIAAAPDRLDADFTAIQPFNPAPAEAEAEEEAHAGAERAEHPEHPGPVASPAEDEEDEEDEVVKVDLTTRLEGGRPQKAEEAQ